MGIDKLIIGDCRDGKYFGGMMMHGTEEVNFRDWSEIGIENGSLCECGYACLIGNGNECTFVYKIENGPEIESEIETGLLYVDPRDKLIGQPRILPGFAIIEILNILLFFIIDR